MKHYLSLFLVAALALQACNREEIDFTWTPSAPRAGERIVFASATTEGDEWVWTFGDGSTASLKSTSTSKTYTEAGTYTVKMQIDKKSWKTRIHEVTVYDTVPTFSASKDTFSTWTEVTFKALVYNPHNYPLHVQWLLPDDAVITEGGTEQTSVSCYFTEPHAEAVIRLSTTLNGTQSIAQRTYRIDLTPAPSLLLLTKDGAVVRARCYDTGISRFDTLMKSGSNPQTRSICYGNDCLYLLDEEQDGRGGIRAYSLRDGSTTDVVTAVADIKGRSFCSAAFYKSTLYWLNTSPIRLYSLATDTRNAQQQSDTDYLLADASGLSGYTATDSIGIAVYNDLFYLGSAKGIYRFGKTDIGSGVAPQTAAIGTEPAQGILLADPINRKLYRADGDISVCNIDGTFPVTLVKGAGSAIALSNALNRLFYMTADGLCSLPLVQTPNNTTGTTPTLLSTAHTTADILPGGIAIDAVNR